MQTHAGLITVMMATFIIMLTALLRAHDRFQREPAQAFPANGEALH